MADESNAPAPAAEEAAPTEAENTETIESTEESEGTEASTEETQEANAANTAIKEQKKEEKKANKKKFKIKVDKAEEDIELDLDNEEEVKKHLQLSRAAQKRMSEMADLKKDVTDLITRLNADPLGVLADAEGGLGLNVDDLVRQYVEKKLAEAEKSPEQLAKEKLESEVKELRDREKKREEELKKKDRELALQGEVDKYDRLMTSALENSEFKKPTPYLVNKMVDYMVIGVQNKINLEPADILPLVKEDLQNEMKQFVDVAPIEVIEAMFGKEIFDRMRKKNLTKAKQNPVHASSIKDTGTTKPAEKKEVPKISYKDFFK